MDPTLELMKNGLSPKDFDKIYQMNLFTSPESRSGTGSTLQQTGHLRTELERLFRELSIGVIIDAPCGDFNWMRLVDLSQIEYIGVDVVDDMIKKNNREFGSRNVQFRVANLISDQLPKADLILCRDLLVHLKFEHGRDILRSFKASGTKYLLCTTFTNRDENTDHFEFWRTLNLEKAPFSLGKPLRVINEKNTEVHLGQSFGDKSLGLWSLQDLAF